jgi:peptidoglycan/LPS O-acetylase OafA/YrhL
MANPDSPPSGATPRNPMLEAIRGLAALQVLFLHLATAFIPAIALLRDNDSGLGFHIHNSPLFFLYDGYTAVFVFFILSGYVLTAPFQRTADRPARTLAARWIRLALPSIAASLFAAAISFVWPREHVLAGAAVDSEWLTKQWTPDPGIVAFWRDAIWHALFIGYQQSGVVLSFGFKPGWLPQISGAYAAPLWTIGVEIVGSLLIFALAAIRRRAARLWLPVTIVALVLLARTPYACFVVGHIAAVLHLAERPPRVSGVVCILGIAAGIFLCVSAEFAALSAFSHACDAPLPVLGCDYAMMLQKRLGAVLIFFSLIAWVDARRLLSSQRLALLGRLSFPIYLSHWPIVFGLGSAVYLAVGVPGLASAAAIAVAVVATIAAAFAFARIDGAAQRLSRNIRGR